VFRALLLKVIDYVDVDRFTVDVDDNLVERFEYDIPHCKSITRILTVMPIYGELCQVVDGANEITGEIGTESKYISTYFRMNLMNVSLKPLSIPGKRNSHITDVTKRCMGLGL